MGPNPNEISTGLCPTDNCDDLCGYCQRILGESDLDKLVAESKAVLEFIDKFHPKTGGKLDDKLQTLENRILFLFKEQNKI